MRFSRTLIAIAIAMLFVSPSFARTTRAGAVSGAVYTTIKDGTAVNHNIYGSTEDVYISGGPQNTNASGLTDGTYYFQVTDPSGKTLLSTDNAVCRKLNVVNGRTFGATGSCPHANGTLNPSNGAIPVKLAPFSKTPNNGNEYKAWLVPTSAATISGSDPKVLIFKNSDAKTDNFKAQAAEVPQGSCAPSSSLSVLVSGSDVVSYVPKGAWSSFGVPGVSAVNVEGSGLATSPTLIPTTSIVNSCASNPTTGQTVCTADNTDVYVIKYTPPTTQLDASVSPNPLSSGGSGITFFSGGVCTNCGVAMDATHNKAVIGLSIGVSTPGFPFGGAGFQFLNLGTATFEPPFASMSNWFFGTTISENPLIDPIRNLLLSAGENNNYEIIDVATSTSPAFYENVITPVSGQLDSSGEDCSTGIVLAPAEFSGPSEVFIADISNPAFATFTPGSPGAWTAPSQVQSLAGSFLPAGASGIAVAQGTHTGVVTGEFGGDGLTAIALPATSGSGAVPAITDWVTCNIGFPWMHGLDPHTVTAYQSPNGGAAIGLLANLGATLLARVDLTAMLALPRIGNTCASGTLPATVVTLIPA
jgi:hypothetical protein